MILEVVVPILFLTAYMLIIDGIIYYVAISS